MSKALKDIVERAEAAHERFEELKADVAELESCVALSSAITGGDACGVVNEGGGGGNHGLKNVVLQAFAPGIAAFARLKRELEMAQEGLVHSETEVRVAMAEELRSEGLLDAARIQVEEASLRVELLQKEEEAGRAYLKMIAENWPWEADMRE